MRLFWPWLPHRYQACFPHSTFGHAEPEIGFASQFFPIQCRQSPIHLSGAPTLLPSNPSSWCRWRPWLPKCCFHCSWAHWHCHHSSMTFPHNKSRLAHCTVHVLAHCIWDIFFTLNVRQHETKMVTIIPFGMTSKADTRPAVKMVQDTITANKICYCTWLAAFELLYCPRSSLHSSPISPPALSPALVLYCPTSLVSWLRIWIRRDQLECHFPMSFSSLSYCCDSHHLGVRVLEFAGACLALIWKQDERWPPQSDPHFDSDFFFQTGFNLTHTGILKYLDCPLLASKCADVHHGMPFRA